MLIPTNFSPSYTCIILDAFAYALAASEATRVISFCATQGSEFGGFTVIGDSEKEFGVWF